MKVFSKCTCWWQAAASLLTLHSGQSLSWCWWKRSRTAQGFAESWGCSYIWQRLVIAADKTCMCISHLSHPRHLLLQYSETLEAEIKAEVIIWHWLVVKHMCICLAFQSSRFCQFAGRWVQWLVWNTSQSILIPRGLCVERTGRFCVVSDVNPAPLANISR